MKFGGIPGVQSNVIQAQEYYQNGIICSNGVVYFLGLIDILMLMGIDDSTYHYNINTINSGAESYKSLNERRAVLIAVMLEQVQRIILTTNLVGIKLRYQYMGYHQLLPEINEIFKVNNIAPISVSTLVRIMHDYNIKTFWERNYVRKNNYSTRNGKPDRRYIAPNRRAMLLYEKPDEWNGGKHIHTGNLKYKFQVISSDIKYYSYGTKGEKVYETILVDEMAGDIVGHYISRSLEAENTTVAALEDMKKNYPTVDFTNTIFNSDQGSQYSCKVYHQAIIRIGGLHSMSPAGKPNYNPRAENMFSQSSKNTRQLLKNVETYEEAVEILIENKNVNNLTKRKARLKYMTSEEFAKNTPAFQEKRMEMEEIYRSIILAA